MGKQRIPDAQLDEFVMKVKDLRPKIENEAERLLRGRCDWRRIGAICGLAQTGPLTSNHECVYLIRLAFPDRDWIERLGGRDDQRIIYIGSTACKSRLREIEKGTHHVWRRLNRAIKRGQSNLNGDVERWWSYFNVEGRFFGEFWEAYFQLSYCHRFVDTPPLNRSLAQILTGKGQKAKALTEANITPKDLPKLPWDRVRTILSERPLL